MVLHELELTNFRSYAARTFNLSPEVTIITGSNASGKTNILEALYVLGLVRSFRAKDQDMVAHGQSFYRIAAKHDQGQISLGFEITPPSSRKQIKHNSASTSQSNHIGTLPVVLFEPGQVAMVDGPPVERRRYLNTLLGQTDRSYLKQLQTYHRALQQRNQVLEQGIKGLNQLFAWDVVLAEAATEIVQARLRLVDFINGRIAGLYA